jgi:ankyrin repeat protein
MRGRLSAVIGLAALFVATAFAVTRADNYFDNPARAARQNDAEAVRGMLAGGEGNPNQTDEESRTALHYAAGNGNVEIIAILIKARAKLDPADSLGNTPLHLAADRHRTAAGELLLAAGAKVDPQNHEGRTPLMVAASRGDTQLVLALLAKGASTTINDYTGRDALAWAEEGRHAAVIAALQRAESTKGR